MILIQGNGEFIAYGIYHRNKSLVSRTTRSMTCDTVRIFSLFISLSLLSFSHMLISCFPNKDKFFPRGKGHGHLQPWSHFPEVLPVERKDMISAPSSQKYPGAGICISYVSFQANFSGQTERQCTVSTWFMCSLLWSRAQTLLPEAVEQDPDREVKWLLWGYSHNRCSRVLLRWGCSLTVKWVNLINYTESPKF